MEEERVCDVCGRDLGDDEDFVIMAHTRDIKAGTAHLCNDCLAKMISANEENQKLRAKVKKLYARITILNRDRKENK